MRKLALVLVVPVLLLAACSTEDGNGDPAPDTTSQDAAEAQDLLPAEEVLPDDVAEVTPHVPGCVGDFCAAGPDHAPDPKEFGPFPVGLRTFQTTLYSHKNVARKLTVDVVYPAVEEARNGPFEAVDLVALAPDYVKEKMPAMEIDPIDSFMVRDADLRREDGPYPLIIFSHGAFGVRFQSLFFTQYLASHGYVVVCPDHVGNTLWDMIDMGGYSMDPVVESAFDRPLDVTHLIDLMLQWNVTKKNFYEGTIDPERVGMSGHSFGGYTSFVQSFEDDRVKIALTMAPATQQLIVWNYDMAKFPVPMMIMAGGLDNTLDTEKDMRQAYENLGTPKYYFELMTAGHYTFTDICSLNLKQLADEIGFGDAEDALDDGCGEENVPVSYAHPLIRQFGIGFLNAYLRESPGSTVYFTEEEGAKYTDELVYKLAE